MRRRIVLGAGLTGIAAAAGALGAARAAERRWRAADDESDGPPTALPAGDDVEIPVSDGALLSATVASAGEEAKGTVVLAHCWTGGRGIWAPVARRLVDRGYRVVLYDQRGHGDSTVGDDGLTIARLGADVRDLFEHLEIDDAVLAGHSMGGMAAQAFTIDHPDVASERVARLVLVATAANGLRVPSTAARGDALVAHPRIERMLRRRSGVALVRSSVGRRACYSHLCAIRDHFVATPGTVRLTLLTAMRGMDLRAGLPSITVPTTVVVGTRDALTPRRLSRALAEAIPKADLVEIPDAGHMLPLEVPDDIADLVAPGTHELGRAATEATA